MEYHFPQIDGLAVLDPGPLYESALANGTPVDFWQKANSVTISAGMEPDTAWFIISREAFDELDATELHTITWTWREEGKATNRVFTSEDWTLIQGTLIGLDGDENAPYLIELRDKRELLKRTSTTVTTDYNVTLGWSQGAKLERASTSGWTWQTLLDDLWGNLPADIAGGSPTLGWTPSHDPDNWRFDGVQAWEAIGRVLAACQSVLTIQSGDFGIVRVGEDVDVPTLARRLIFDGKPEKNGPLPETIRTVFWHRTFEPDDHEIEVRDEVSAIDDATSDVVLEVRSDLIFEGEDTNETPLDVAAAENAARVAEILECPQLEQHYSGLQFGVTTFELSSGVHQIRIRDYGDHTGLVTEVRTLDSLMQPGQFNQPPVPRPWELKAVTAETIEPESLGQVEVWLNDEASGLFLDAWLAWAHCDQSIDNGEEVLIRFFRDEEDGEGRWLIFKPNCPSGGGGGDANACLDPCPCCDPDEVSQFKFILTDVTGSDTDCCGGLNGEYTLERDTDVGGCRWVYCEEGYCRHDGTDLDLKIILTYQGVNPLDKCNCTLLNLEVALVEHDTGKTRFYLQFTKQITQTEDCCLISEQMELACYRSDICDVEAETEPTGQVCALCDPFDCAGCDDTQKRFVKVAVADIGAAECGLAELLNTTHVLYQVVGEIDECAWSEDERTIDECTAQFRLIATLGGIGVEWELTLTTSHEGDPDEVLTWTGESLTCDVTDLELTSVDTGDDVDISSATISITSENDACEEDECCPQPDQLPLNMTLLSACQEDLDGESHEMEPDEGIDVHQGWEITEDWFVCNGGLLNFRARLVCTDGNYRLTFFGTGTTSGCTKDDTTLIPTSVQCDPFELHFETTISNTGSPVDCLCCDEGGFPIDVEIVITLGDGPQAADTLGEELKVVITESGGIDAGESGTALVWIGGAATATTIPVHFNWMGASNTAAEGAEALVRWFADEAKWVIVELEC